MSHPNLNLWGANAWVLLFHDYYQSEPAGRVVPFLWGVAGNEPRKWAPHFLECLQRGCLEREVWEEEEFQLDKLDCWRDLESSGLGAVAVDCTCFIMLLWQWWPMLHPHSEKGTAEETHLKEVALMKSVEAHDRKDFLKGHVSPLGHAFSLLMFLSQLDPMIILSLGQLWCLLTQLTFQLNSCLIEIVQSLEDRVIAWFFLHLSNPVLDWEGRWMRWSTAKLGDRDSVPPLNLSTDPLGNGVHFQPHLHSSWGKITLASEKGSSLHRHSWSSGNWEEDMPPERVLTS